MPRHSLTWRVLHFAAGEWTSIAAIGILCSTSTPPASAGEHVSFAQTAAIRRRPGANGLYRPTNETLAR
jgi:hypothetical protein